MPNIARTKSEAEKIIGLPIPDGCKIVAGHYYAGQNIAVKRPDGLVVFLSPKDDALINRIRLNEPNAYNVMLAVGLYRGLQIANSYKNAHGQDFEWSKKVDFLKMLHNTVALGEK